MKKPPKNSGMIYVCKKCRKEMPIDNEKSTKEQTFYKRECSCGGRGEAKFIC